nr:hypothetical protein [Candidatus Babeliales bacterium]
MKKIFFLTALVILNIDLFSCESPLSSCQNSTCQNSQNFFQFRSFSSYSSEELSMIKTLYQNEITCDEVTRDFWQGTFSVAPKYMQNFSDSGLCGCKSLGSLPFWSGTNTMTYGGHNGTTNLDPYQFGMGDVDGIGSITLNADIVHVGADMLLHMVYHKDKPGFYFTLRAPLGAMSVSSTLCENVAAQDVPANELTDEIWLSYPSQANMFDSMTQAFQAGSVSTLDAQVIVASSLHRAFALENGRVAACKQTVIRLADISLALGYQFKATPQGFLGAGIKFTMPTGNVPTGKYMLEPIFGRAGYWGVGAELLGHYKIFEHIKRDRGLDFWIKGEILHLCSGRQPNMRSFDLTLNGPGSKYLLLQKYFLSTPSEDNPSGAIPSFITQAVNITTLPVISRFNLEGNFSFLFDAHEQNMNFAIGAEIWGRSQERLTLDACNLLHVN